MKLGLRLNLRFGWKYQEKLTGTNAKHDQEPRDQLGWAADSHLWAAGKEKARKAMWNPSGEGLRCQGEDLGLN